jgi:hypothetical protein
MSVLPLPTPDDVIIARASADSFVLGDSSGTPQIVCGSFEELLHRALRFAGQQHAHLWYTRDGGTCAPVIDVALLHRMWSEFVEMPGLRLTRAQAQRLWGVDPETCLSALETLVALKLLVRSVDEKYSRPSVLTDQPFGRTPQSDSNAGAFRRAG